MRKLGIDIGSSSLGWTLRNDDNTFTSGVITFKSGMVKGTGGYSSPTKDRREARSKRKLIQARKYRKWELLEILLNGYVPLAKTELEDWSKYKKGRAQKFPENPNFLKWLKCDFSYVGVATEYNNPYELRISALDNKKKLHKHELGRALYHLVQRRGYKDIGEADKETEKQIERRGESGFQKALDENRTIAEALQKEFLGKGKRARNQYPYRNEYENELLEILKAQKYDVSTNGRGEYQNEFVQKVRSAIIWQRPLRTQKGNIGKCTLEPTKPRCPVSHPVFEIFRAWSFINTIRYIDENGKKKNLEAKERNLLFEFFMKKEKNFKFEDIKTQLNKQLGNKTQYNYPLNKEGIYDTSVSGMPVCKGLIDVFGDNVKNVLANLHQYNIGNAPKIINDYSIYDLWHILFAFDERTAKDKTFLEKFAIEKLNIQNEKNKKGKEYNSFAKLKANITTGYADLSLKALCKIIPFLKDGYLYNEAVVLAKIPELLGENWGQNKDTIEALVHESNEKYNWHKTIVGVANNLIDQYKGLEPQEAFAYKDFQYHLVKSDLNDIEKACIGSFGEKTWNDKTENEKQQILDEVRTEYQEFFHDERRAYRRTPLLTDIFKEKLKEKNIEINGKLYHHSNIENRYLKKYTDPKTGTIKLPVQIDKDTGAVTKVLPQPIIDSIKNPMFNKAMSIVRKLINDLLKTEKIDEDTEVVIEVARELNDNNKRIAIERYQRERETKRGKYREFLKEFNQKENRNINVEESIPAFELWTEQIFEEIEDENGKKINKNTAILKEKEAINRYELWTEQKGQCMYTGKMISISKLFSADIDIMHTIPRWLLPDNTMANKTVGFKMYNKDLQGKKLPTQCANYDKEVEGWGTSITDRLGKWEETRDNWKKLYEDRLKPKGNEDQTAKNKRVQEKHYFKMHYDYWKEKVERFTAEEVKDSWARRQLVDTQMVSKYAREFLKAYFKKVAVQKGSVTADFRKIYSFQDEDKIKDRNRHTHHAIDAAVLTLIPVNSSHRERILKEYYEAVDNFRPMPCRVPFAGFNSQALIQNIENNTLIVNYENDKILNQTYKNVRKRGELQYLKDKQGKFKLDENSNKIPLKAKGDTVRSELYAQTYLGKIKDVERYDDGQPKRKGGDWEYKTGKDEFVFVKREPIDKVKASDKLIEAIIDPIIKKLVKDQKSKLGIKDYQGKIIRHVRIKTSAGKEVKERVNYTSKYDYKNKFYSESGSLPYAVLLQNNNNERVMIPVASFELAKAYKKHGSFVIDEYLKKYDKENNTKYADYPGKKLLKVGQKVIILKEDAEYDKRKDVDFQTKRLYVITQFSEGSIWLKYHLEAQSKDEIKDNISVLKDELLRKYEIKEGINEVVEDLTIQDNKKRKDDYESRRYRFDTISNSFRLKLLSEKIGLEKAKDIKNELDKFKAISSSIEIEGKTPLLKMASKNWNFLYEGEDFKVSLLGEIEWIER
ncbi:MAG: hypothetical protein M9933_00010 [Chitinophagaceae bacterium]|nr:hypothetical protein [Chitinophagaceae bacterium]